MKYTKDNIIGLKVRHFNYKKGDHKGEYQIVIKNGKYGINFYNTHYKEIRFSSYLIDEILKYIQDGSWIPIEINYEIY